MKKPVLLGVFTLVAACLVGGASFADTKMLPAGPLPTAAPPSPICAASINAKVTIDGPQRLSFYSEKPVGAAGWTSFLVLTGKTDSPCASITGLQISSDEPEGRAALQTCAAMSAGLKPGQHMNIGGQSTIRSDVAGNMLRLRNPLMVACNID
jgi:hypothetical protein